MAALARVAHPRVLRVLRGPLDAGPALVYETEPVGPPLAPAALAAASAVERQLAALDVCEAAAAAASAAELRLVRLSPRSFVAAGGGFKLWDLLLAVPAADAAARVDVGALLRGAPEELAYVAPELAAADAAPAAAAAAFSVGCVVYELHSGRPAVDPRNPRASAAALAALDVSALPPALAEPLRGLLCPRPDDRLLLADFLRGAYFRQTAPMTVLYLRDLARKQPASKLAFFAGLADAVPQFPAAVAKARLLDPLLAELETGRGQEAAVIRVLSRIAETHCSRKEVAALMLPRLGAALCAALAAPPGSPAAPTAAGSAVAPAAIEPARAVGLLHVLPLFAQFAQEESIRKVLIPFFLRALQVPNVVVQQAAFTVLPGVADVVPPEVLKRDVFPRIEFAVLMAAFGGKPVLRATIVQALGCIVPQLPKPLLASAFRVLALRPPLPASVPAASVPAVRANIERSLSGPLLLHSSRVCLLISARVEDRLSVPRFLVPFAVSLLAERGFSAVEFDEAALNARDMFDATCRERGEAIARSTATVDFSVAAPQPARSVTAPAPGVSAPSLSAGPALPPPRALSTPPPAARPATPPPQMQPLPQTAPAQTPPPATDDFGEDLFAALAASAVTRPAEQVLDDFFGGASSSAAAPAATFDFGSVFADSGTAGWEPFSDASPSPTPVSRTTEAPNAGGSGLIDFDFFA